MQDIASLQIDCDASTVTVAIEPFDLRKAGSKAVETHKSQWIAMILCLQSKELMAMSKSELMARYLVMIEPKA